MTDSNGDERRKPVYDGKTGEAMTVEGAKGAAAVRYRRQYLTMTVKPLDAETPPETGQVYDPVADETVTVAEAKRRAQQRVESADEAATAADETTDAGRETVTEDDAGKLVVTPDGDVKGVLMTADEFIETRAGADSMPVYEDGPAIAEVGIPARGMLLPISPEQIVRITDDQVVIDDSG